MRMLLSTLCFAIALAAPAHASLSQSAPQSAPPVIHNRALSPQCLALRTSNLRANAAAEAQLLGIIDTGSRLTTSVTGWGMDNAALRLPKLLLQANTATIVVGLYGNFTMATQNLNIAYQRSCDAPFL